MRSRRILLGVAAGLLGALMFGGPAFAAPAVDDGDRIAPLILEVMAEVPGGVVVDSWHAVWPELGMELVVGAHVRAVSIAAVGSCTTGLVCVYTGTALTGARLSWSTCGILPIPTSFSVRSLADARSGGYAQARNGATVLATAPAGGWTNVNGTSTNVRCVL